MPVLRVVGYSFFAAMPDHKFKRSINPDLRPWWRTWNDYPDPMRDGLLALFGISIIAIVFWFLLT